LTQIAFRLDSLRPSRKWLETGAGTSGGAAIKLRNLDLGAFDYNNAMIDRGRIPCQLE